VASVHFLPKVETERRFRHILQLLLPAVAEIEIAAIFAFAFWQFGRTNLVINDCFYFGDHFPDCVPVGNSEQYFFGFVKTWIFE
jgi:hypothetical protein